MEVAKFSKTSVTIYEITLRHIQKELNIYNTVVRTSDFAKISPLIVPIYLRRMNSKLATVMRTQYGIYMFIFAPYS
jgi:hypothetical protein